MATFHTFVIDGDKYAEIASNVDEFGMHIATLIRTSGVNHISRRAAHEQFGVQYMGSSLEHPLKKGEHSNG